MKPVILFFLFLCAHLSGAHEAHASGHPGVSYAAVLDIGKTDHAETTPTPYWLTTRNAGLVQDNSNLFSVENEDEEDTIRKQISLARFLLICSYALILSCFCSLAKEQLPFDWYQSNTSSRKYILQRVLRL